MSVTSELSEQDRARLRLEEEYRHEVRKSLEALHTDHSAKARLWSLLNSSFGVWLLSAFFITGLGGLYAKYESAHAEELSNLQAIERLDLEIEYRWSEGLQRLYLVKVEMATLPVDQRPSIVRIRIRNILTSFYLDPKIGLPALYPEFKEFSTLAAIAELRRRLPLDVKVVSHESSVLLPLDEQPLRVVELALMKLSGLPSWMNDNESALDDPEKVAKYLQEMRPKRWSDHFYFTDCPSSTPSC